MSHTGSHLVSEIVSNNEPTQSIDKEVIVMKDLLWVQQNKLFSWWKERCMVLTSHDLQSFREASSRISKMGDFIMKVGSV